MSIIFVGEEGHISADAVKQAEPGVYVGVPEGVYHSLDICSASRLAQIDERSERYMRWQADTPTEPTESMSFGTMVHMAILEPDRFSSDYIKVFDGTTRQKAYKELVAEYGRDRVVTVDAREKILRMRKSVMAHPEARSILEPGLRRYKEATLIWQDEIAVVSRETGEYDRYWLTSRGRADVLNLDTSTPLIADLKTTHDASPEAFGRTIWNFRYHQQGAMYRRGLAAIRGVVADFAWIAVETVEPFDVVVYQAPERLLRVGAAQIQKLLTRYATAEWSGVWPGIAPEGRREIDIPHWAYNQI